MRQMGQSADARTFRLGARETEQLLKILALYPRVPAGHQSVSGAANANSDAQRLLEDSMAEQRAVNKQLLEALLADPARFRKDNKGAVLTLSDGDQEWLLQVLNDIRVGSWVRAGAPERLDEDWLNENTLKDAWAMEMAGYFQMHLLRTE